MLPIWSVWALSWSLSTPHVLLSVSLAVFLGHKFLMNSEPGERSASSCEIYALVSITAHQIFHSSGTSAGFWRVYHLWSPTTASESSVLNRAAWHFLFIPHFFPFWDKLSQEEQEGHSSQCEVRAAVVGKDMVSDRSSGLYLCKNIIIKQYTFNFNKHLSALEIMWVSCARILG